MKKKLRKIFSVFTMIVALLLTLVVSVSAMEMINYYYVTVDLAANKTYALSSTFSAKYSYIDANTYNNPISTQDMRAQFHYRSGLSWVYDERVFVAPGNNAPVKYSSVFSNNHTWRLGLSPKIENNKGVSGMGKAFYPTS